MEGQTRNMRLSGCRAVGWVAGLTLALGWIWWIPACAATGAHNSDKLKVLIVTGGHGFEKAPFFKMFEENPEISFTTAAHEKTNATVYERSDLLSYDVVVLYDLPKEITETQ